MGFKLAAEDLDLQCSIYVNNIASPEACANLDAKPIFESTSYHTSKLCLSAITPKALLRIKQLSHGFARDCEAGIENYLDAQTIIYVDSPSEYIIEGLSIWLSKLTLESMPKLYLFLSSRGMLLEGTDQPGYFADYFQHAVKRLESVVGDDNLHITSAVSQFMDDPRENILGVTLHKFPLPKYYASKQPCQGIETNRASTLTISFLGQVDSRKNSRLLPDIIQRVNEQATNIAFFVQCYPEGEYALKLAVEISRRLSTKDNVTISKQQLETEEYFSVLENSDIIVLPYNEKKYRHITSGVLAEAIAFGIPCVVPANTWSEKALEYSNGAGVSFSEDSISGIAEAIQKCMVNIEHLRQKGQAAARQWREEQSITAYLQKIVQQG